MLLYDHQLKKLFTIIVMVDSGGLAMKKVLLIAAALALWQCPHEPPTFW